MVSLAKRDSIRLRANFCCEYCSRELQGDTDEIDHILPESLGGDNSLENLALSCARCNRNKGKRIVFLDPISRQTVLLFNPRKHQWSRHFRKIENEIVGKTPRGSATAALLFRITDQYNPPDLLWDKLDGLERSERLYRFLNLLRFRRLHNQFKALEAGLAKELPAVRNKKEAAIVTAAKLLLKLELLFTRSTERDILAGIRLAEKNLNLVPVLIQKELRLILSILYQQRASVCYIKGDIKGAMSDQRKANEWIDKTDSLSGIPSGDQGNLRNILRAHAVKTKYESVDVSKTMLTNLLRASIDLNDKADFRHFTYMTDVALSSLVPDTKTIEALYAALTGILDDSGYGQTIDRARFVTLRRRWWYLHLMIEQRPWIDALISDVDYWRRISEYNDIRELKNGISQFVTKLNPSNARVAILEIEEWSKRISKRERGILNGKS